MNAFRIWFIIFSSLYAQSTHSQSLLDVTQEAGIDQHESNQLYGSGISLFDYDSDGWIDIHVSTAFGTPGRVFRNLEGQYELITAFPDENGGSVASLWMDYNGDHLVDLLCLNSCFEVENCDQPVFTLYQQTANGGFIDITSESQLHNFPGYELEAMGGLAAGDINLDGFLDFVYTTWSNGHFKVFLNDGKGAFYEDTSMFLDNEFGLHYFQPLLFDFDYDNDTDILFNVDRGPNQLYVNSDFNFEEQAALYSLNANNNEMGLTIGDFDNNGLLDLFMTNITFHDQNNILYAAFSLGQNNVQYSEIAQELNVAKSGWGWGTTFLDLDNDTFLDLCATNGWIQEDQSVFWKNKQGESFIDISESVGFNDSLRGVTLLTFDYNRDGKLDLIQSFNPTEDNTRTIRMLKNNNSANGNYLVVKPRMIGSNHFGIGSKITIESEGLIKSSLITAGTSFYGQEPAEAHFGLGTKTAVEKITVTWPGGSTTTIENIAVNQVVEISDQNTLHIPRFHSVKLSESGKLLQWNHISSFEDAFEMESASNAFFVNSKTTELNGSLRSVLDNQFDSEIEYYRIRALSGNITSPWSPPYLVANLNSPENLQIVYYDGQKAKLNWEDKSSYENGYILERSLTPDFESAISIDLSLNTDLYEDDDLEPGFKYYYRVAAIFDQWKSAYSNTVETSSGLGTIRGLGEIYPNPGDRFIKVPVSIPVGDQLRIVSLSGKELVLKSTGDHTFEISHLSAGLYLLPEFGLRFIKK